MAASALALASPVSPTGKAAATIAALIIYKIGKCVLAARIFASSESIAEKTQTDKQILKTLSVVETDCAIRRQR